LNILEKNSMTKIDKGNSDE